MIVTVSGSSGETNAYRSEESATGSLLISGASRCEDMSKPLSALDGFEQAGGELLVGQCRLRAAGEDVERALGGIPQRDHQRLTVVLRGGLAGQAQPGDTGDGRSDTRRGGDGEDPAAGQAVDRPAAVTNATHARPFVISCGRSWRACNVDAHQYESRTVVVQRFSRRRRRNPPIKAYARKPAPTTSAPATIP